MKKTFFSAAALLLCLSAASQTAELSVIGRLEGNHRQEAPDVTVPGLNWGNSSLYTYFTSDFSEHFSFEMLNLWVNCAPAELYKATFHSDASNWMQICNFSFNAGGFRAVAGKQFINVGGFEGDEWDYDIDFDLASRVWNVPITQWGVAVGYTLPSDKSSFMIQALASPYGERPFASGLWCFTGEWRGNFGPLHTRWTGAAMGVSKGKYIPFFSLGQNIDLGECWNIGAEYHWYNGSTIIGTIDFNPSQNWEIFAKGGWEGSRGNIIDDEGELGDSNGWYAGGALRFYPLKKSRDLRLHAAGSYRSLTGYSFTVGATFNLRIFSVK